LAHTGPTNSRASLLPSAHTVPFTITKNHI
jgi:hypothetical protein